MNDPLEQKYRDSFYRIENAFEEAFFDELDSWFAAGEVLCRSCYHDFAKCWPGLVASDSFQRGFTDIDVFYDGSKKLQHRFRADEYTRLLGLVECNRCGWPISDEFWAYNPMPREMELDIEAIAKIASETPFLVLRHSFARRVFNLIDFVGKASEPRKVLQAYYRARKRAELNSREPNEFFPPPAEKATEGRYNHNGQRVLYVGSDERTCVLELEEPECGVCLAEVILNLPLKILDFHEMDQYSDCEEDRLLRMLALSSLLSSPRVQSGWRRPEYVFTRFVADCARSAGFQAIKYPSCRTGRGHNLVVLYAPDEDWKTLIRVSTAQD